MQRDFRKVKGKEQGQFLPILALMSAVLVGGAALAIDLGLRSADHRTLQVAADAAAERGVQDLTGIITQVDRQNAAINALRVIGTTMNWNTGGKSWTSWANAELAMTVNGNDNSRSCSSSSNTCFIVVQGPGTTNNYTVTVATPPTTANNSQFNGDNSAVEVNFSVKQPADFAGVLGISEETASAHAVAEWAGGGNGFPAAVWSASQVIMANAPTYFLGDIIADQYVDLQSVGQASICVTGHIFLELPQNASIGQSQALHVSQFTHLTSCANISGGVVGFVGTAQQCNFWLDGVTATPAGTVWNSTYNACILPQLALPSYGSPTTSASANTYCSSAGLDPLMGKAYYRPGIYQCGSGASLTIDHPLEPGIYQIEGNGNSAGDVVMNQQLTGSCSNGTLGSGPIPSGSTYNFGSFNYASYYSSCLLGVTFIVENGASMNLAPGNGLAGLVMSPYISSSTSNPYDNVFTIYSPPGAGGSLTLPNSFNLVVSGGSIYLPNGAINIGNKSDLQVDGQVITSFWNAQGGNNNSYPSVYLNSSFIPQLTPAIKLVE